MEVHARNAEHKADGDRLNGVCKVLGPSRDVSSPSVSDIGLVQHLQDVEQERECPPFHG
jgi:hypothetical protein